MTNEELKNRLNQKCIDALARERVEDVLNHKKDVDILFRPYYDFFDSDDLKIIKNEIKEALANIRLSYAEEQISPEVELLELFTVFSSVKDAMRDLVVMMCHVMRDECDYAGLTELHDAGLKLPYNLYRPLAYLVFNDIYDTVDVFSQEDGSVYQSVVKHLNEHFQNLRQKADEDWARCQATAISDDDGNSDFTTGKMTIEYLHSLWEKHSAYEDVLLIATVEKRELLALAYVMLIEHILRSLILERTNSMRENNDYYGLTNLMRRLDKMEGLSEEKRKKCVGLLVSRSDN